MVTITFTPTLNNLYNHICKAWTYDTEYQCLTIFVLGLLYCPCLLLSVLSFLPLMLFVGVFDGWRILINWSANMIQIMRFIKFNLSSSIPSKCQNIFNEPPVPKKITNRIKERESTSVIFCLTEQVTDSVTAIVHLNSHPRPQTLCLCYIKMLHASMKFVQSSRWICLYIKYIYYTLQ